jgi:hypothetical protein
MTVPELGRLETRSLQLWLWSVFKFDVNLQACLKQDLLLSHSAHVMFHDLDKLLFAIERGLKLLFGLDLLLSDLL